MWAGEPPGLQSSQAHCPRKAQRGSECPTQCRALPAVTCSHSAALVAEGAETLPLMRDDSAMTSPYPPGCSLCPSPGLSFPGSPSSPRVVLPALQSGKPISMPCWRSQSCKRPPLLVNNASLCQRSGGQGLLCPLSSGRLVSSERPSSRLQPIKLQKAPHTHDSRRPLTGPCWAA